MAIVADGIMGGDGETSESCLFPASWPGRAFFFRGTHNVRDELQLSHFVG